MSKLGKLWTSPNTLLGVTLGALGLLSGARIRLGDNAVLFLDHWLITLTPARAVTFGNCVLYRRGAHPEMRVERYDGRGEQRIGDHEHAHTIQYEYWGPAFLPVYLALALLPGTHPLETQADRWAEIRGELPGRET